MRSAYVTVNQDHKRKNEQDFDFLKEDLHSHIKSLENCKNDTAKANRLSNKINQLKAKITKRNLEKGENLANKLKTKWYNEGERSNKYFLALLRRKELNGQLKELEINNTTITDQDKIEEEVTSFYRDLYNQESDRYTNDEKESLLGNLELTLAPLAL